MPLRSCFYLFMIVTFCSSHAIAGTYLEGILGGAGQGTIVRMWQYSTLQYRYEVYNSLRTDADGRFRTVQPGRAGLYGISFIPGATTPSILLWLGEGHPVRFRMAVSEKSAHPIWTEDVSNRDMQALHAGSAELMHRLRLCGELLDLYPDSSRFHGQLRAEYRSIQQEMRRFSAEAARTHPQSVAGRIASRQFLVYPGEYSPARTAVHSHREAFLDSVDFSDPVLQRSHLLPEKIDQYLRLYGYPGQFKDPEAASAAILPAAEALILHCLRSTFTQGNPVKQLQAVQYVSNYLFRQFSRTGMDDLTDAIAILIPDELLRRDLCNETETVSESDLVRLRRYKQLVPGRPAPDFLPVSADGAGASLHALPSAYKLLVFWASDCPHCESLLPELAAVYKATARTELEIIAVSLDRNVHAWQEKSRSHPWISHYSGKSWNDPVVEAYGITGTPSMFLIDRSGKIAGKPRSAEDVLQMTGKH